MTQLFKKKIDDSIITYLVNNIFIKYKNYFILDSYCYKKALMENKIKHFLDKIKKFYFKSKLFYVEREMTFKYFSTIVRQICKNALIPFTTKLFYYKSTYEIKYFIYPKLTA